MGPDATNGDHHPDVGTDLLEGHERRGIGFGQLTGRALVGGGTGKCGIVRRGLGSGPIDC